MPDTAGALGPHINAPASFTLAVLQSEVILLSLLSKSLLFKTEIKGLLLQEVFLDQSTSQKEISGAFEPLQFFACPH